METKKNILLPEFKKADYFLKLKTQRYTMT
jgi:hypothetical protein